MAGVHSVVHAFMLACGRAISLSECLLVTVYVEQVLLSLFAPPPLPGTMATTRGYMRLVSGLDALKPPVAGSAGKCDDDAW